MNSIKIYLRRIRVDVTDVKDDWFRIDVYYTDFECDSSDWIDLKGDGNSSYCVHKDIIQKVPLFTLYETYENIITGNTQYQHNLMMVEAKYCPDSPLTKFILEALDAARDVIIWKDELEW